jgi:hypothetical protein
LRTGITKPETQWNTLLAYHDFYFGTALRVPNGVAYHVLDRSTQLFPCARSRGIKLWEINCGGTAFGLDLEVSIDGNYLNQAAGIQFNAIPGCCASSGRFGGYSMTMSFEWKTLSACAVPKTRALLRRTPAIVLLKIGSLSHGRPFKRKH